MGACSPGHLCEAYLVGLRDDLVELVQLALLGSDGSISLLHLSSCLVHLKPERLSLLLHLHQHHLRINTALSQAPVALAVYPHLKQTRFKSSQMYCPTD